MKKAWVLVIIVVVVLGAIMYSRETQARQARHDRYVRALRKKQRLFETRREQLETAQQVRDGEFLQRMHQLASSSTWDSVVELGDVYRKGEYPLYRPNKDAALELYHIASFSQTLGSTARSRFLECSQDPLASEDVSGAALPTTYKDLKLQTAKSMVLSSSAVRPEQRPERLPDVPPEPIVSDAQNVHDHSLTKHLQKALTEMPSGKNSYEDVVTWVLEESNATPEQKADAYTVLDSLSDSRHSTLKVSERESLDKMWQKIQGLPEYGREAKDLLVSQLASGVEHGDVVCSTGKIARIMGTLDGITETPVNKPMWALREELGTLAARVRDTEAPAEEFRRQALETYVKSLGMSDALVTPLIEEFSLGF